jgi:ABC-type xylose transport system substrate-binding protein
MSSDADAVQTELKTTETEKETVMKVKSHLWCGNFRKHFDVWRVIKERDKVVLLMADLQSQRWLTSLSKYKTQFAALQNNMKVLMQENEGLKKQMWL